jgi:isoleucyl-tRNA synthetase
MFSERNLRSPLSYGRFIKFYRNFGHRSTIIRMKNKPFPNGHFFEPVNPQVNFPEEEKKLIDSWYDGGVVRKYLQKNKNSEKYFSFLDGPITANNPMGVHHAWGRSYKDLWQKYKNMRGFKQRFQNGFDAQGLWVEVEVEKELGFKSKKDIEQFGVAKFVQLCRDRVKKYSDIQTNQSKRLGYFMDWDHSYFTLSEDNNYMIWHFLKTCAENGWIYKGHDSVPWCPRCQTAISQHEMLTEDYKEITHESVYLAFPEVGRENEYFLVWTTTPWTVPANIAIAVDEKLEYSLVQIKNKSYWLAKDTVDRVLGDKKYKVLKTVLGSKLVGIRYKGAFDDLPAVSAVSSKSASNFHTVVPTDSMILPITTEEGTGLVHTAVSAGSEDFKLGKKLGLPMIPVIADDASYLPGMGEFEGLNAKKNPRVILDYLVKKDEEGKHYYYKTENITHRYPACWRCKTELVWKVTDEWYIAMDKPSKLKPKVELTDLEKWENGDDERKDEVDVRTLRQRMIDVAKKISWKPKFGLERELDWLNNMHDWLISKKNRYWGLALPIWECKECGNFEIIGSHDELKEKAVEGWKEFEGKTPHKPQIDSVKIKCSRCGSVIQRIEPVGNPWLDAGIVAFSTISENNEACNFEPTKTKPAYLADRKNWENWYPADFITESFPGQFKNWFYALIAMSTVLEDENPFKTVLGFGTLLGEDGRAMHKSWGNSIEFNEGADKIGVDVARWMFARQNPADNMLFGYRMADEVRRRFHLRLWNIYNFFVTYANLDGFQPKKLKKVKSPNTLDKWILARLHQTVRLVSSGLDDYDSYKASQEIDKFIDDLSLWYIRRSRDRVGPAADSEIDKNNFYTVTHHVLVTISQILSPFNPFITELIFKNLTKEESVHLSDWPAILPEKPKEERLVAEMAVAREVTELAHALRKEKGIAVRQPLAKLSVKNFVFGKDVMKIIKEELNVKDVVSEKGKGELSVELDTVITPELQAEAEIRDLVRKIQDERKKMGLNLTQQINVSVEKIPSNKKLTHWMTRKAQILNLTQGAFKVEKV